MQSVGQSVTEWESGDGVGGADGMGVAHLSESLGQRQRARPLLLLRSNVCTVSW